ncbi:cytochrome b561 [Aliarcobacter faecis]|uniref:cytochrome b/b6 domain-containing protein n=1 Tax=Aliarcobacter faecis TaxID=1564138 RepID=UPI00047A13CB|nr:cytochrome b/b6 domain-containing protein [Aliarcobacter faecis]QKF73635.1 cytochrome b561 [Aliarcobacter faecis]
MGYFNSKKSLNLRVWHWFNFIAIFGLMFTYIFRETWFDKTNNALLIKNKLLEFGLEISNEKSVVLAKMLRETMWNWHYIFGFMLVFLLILRFYAFFINMENNPLSKLKEKTNTHIKIVNFTHFIFYIITFYVCISGVIMFFKDDLNLTKESLKLVKELHAYSFWFFLFFVFTHIFGVIKAEISSDKGLISEMFSGGQDSK